MLKITHLLKRLFASAFIEIHIEDVALIVSLKSINGDPGLLRLIDYLDIKPLIVVFVYIPDNLLICADIAGLLKQFICACIK
ncbi:hypothetical protein D3C80_1836900 [compost metagenome]